MLQIIGFIVAIYAMTRLVQVPIEMTAGREECLGFPFSVRLMVLAGLSLAGLLGVGFMTLMLLFSGSSSQIPGV